MAFFFLSFRFGGAARVDESLLSPPGCVGLRRIVRVRCCLLPTSFPFPVGGGWQGRVGVRAPPPFFVSMAVPHLWQRPRPATGQQWSARCQRARGSPADQAL